MKTISRYLMTLVALFAMTTGAWANIATIEFTKETMPGSWKNNFTLISPDYLPDFKPASDAEAIAWDGASKTKKTILIYGFDGEKVKSVKFNPAGGYQTGNEISTLYDFYEQVMENDYIVCYTTFGVILNDTKTEASFDMPTYDMTVDYELVRDLQLEVEFDGLPGNARVAKNQEGKFQLVDAFTINLLDNIDPNNVKSITKNDGINFTIVKIVEIEEEPYYRIDEESAMSVEDFLADAQPGIYCIKATASETSPYDGYIYSSMFNLFQGYEVYVPAHEYVTYCSTEALTLEDENAALYTITAVSNSEATLSRALTVAPATTPLLVENNSDESRTILLIPTDKQADDVTPAEEFIGVLDADRDLYKNNTFDFYAFNGLDFVLVNNLVTIPVGKCFIGIQTGNLSARSITIRRSATAIDATLMNNEEMNNEQWFDLNGRKVNKPTKKGIYIKNGQKVVIK